MTDDLHELSMHACGMCVCVLGKLCRKEVFVCLSVCVDNTHHIRESVVNEKLRRPKNNGQWTMLFLQLSICN